MLTITRTVAAITATAAMALTASACSTAATAATPLEKTDIVVAVPHIIQGDALFLAIKYGFFTRVGLHVKVVFDNATTQPSVLAGMQDGAVDVNAAANYVSFFRMQATGQMNVRVLADTDECDPGALEVLSLPRSGIDGPADLPGKRVAVQINPNIQTLTLDQLLISDGLNPATVHYVAITFPKMIAALKAHQVDAVSLVEPFISEAEAELGATDVMSQCTGPVADLPQSGYIVTAAWARKYPHTAEAFRTAIEQASALAATNRAAIEQILPTYISMSPPQLPALVDVGLISTTVNASQLQRVATLMLEGGLLRSRLDVRPLIFTTENP